MRIVQRVPTEGGSPFSGALLDGERAAAERLGVELEPIYCRGGHAGADAERTLQGLAS